MCKNWFNKLLLDSKTVEHSSFFKNFKKYLRHSYLWQLDKEPIARGVAIGLFAGIVPIIPLQTLLTLFLSIILRGNFPVAFLASWISNPLTIFPITYFIYYVGDTIIGRDKVDVSMQQFSWHFANLNEFWIWFTQWAYQSGKAFFVGLPIVSIGAALIGYFTVTIIWHGADFFQRHMKKNKD